MLVLDGRSLRLFRIMLGVLVMVDMIDRMYDIYPLYSDYGILSRNTLAIEKIEPYYALSIYQIAGEPFFVSIICLLHLLTALWMIFSPNKLNTILLYYFHTSIQTRNAYVGHAGDMYTRVVLFWSLLMPYSMESSSSWGALGYAIQIQCMYLTSLYWKSGAEWRLLGTASYYALHLRYFITPLGELLASLPLLGLRLSTFAVLGMEGLGSILLLIPSIRIYGIVLLVLLHIGLGLTMRLGTFTMVTVTAVIPFIPGSVWDHIHPFVRGRLPYYRMQWKFQRGSIYAYVLPLLQCLTLYLFDWEEVDQSTPFTCILNDRRYEGGMGILAAALASPLFILFQPFQRILPYAPAGPYQVMRRKKEVGSRWPWSYMDRYQSMVLHGVVLLSVAYILCYNASEVGILPPTIRNVMPMQLLTFAFRLDQKWNMFSPTPPKEVWWHNIEGVLEDGRVIDVFRDESLFNFKGSNFTRQEWGPLWPSYRNHRWYKLWEGINSGPKYEVLRLNLGRYICREWNRGGRPRLVRHLMWYHVKATPLPWEAEQAENRQLLWNHIC